MLRWGHDYADIGEAAYDSANVRFTTCPEPPSPWATNWWRIKLRKLDRNLPPPDVRETTLRYSPSYRCLWGVSH